TNVFGSSSSTSTTDSTTSTTSSDSTSSTPFSLAINVDGAKDLVPFTYGVTRPTAAAISSATTTGTTSALLLNPHVTAYDTSEVGAIQGTLKLGNLTGISTPSTASYVDIQVTAESLSVDGSRHVAINSAPVRSDGTFTLYPLATDSSSPTS